MQRFAVICASGIGDALLMQITAKHLRTIGHEVVTFSNFLEPLASWFPGFSFAPQPTAEQLSSFDGIVLQHDNSLKAKKIHVLNKPVYTLYGDYSAAKHGPFRPGYDYAFDRTICMAENISYAMGELFPEAEADLANGITPPPHLIRGRHQNRVLINPVSSSSLKDWPKSSFLELYDLLHQAEWDPVFIVPPEKAKEWNAPLFPTLSDLAAFIYESSYLIGTDSGPGHLASNLGLPTVIIGPSKEHLTFWRPGWRRGEIAHPPSWTQKTKLTKQNWKHFISVSRVNKQFKKLTDIK